MSEHKGPDPGSQLPPALALAGSPSTQEVGKPGHADTQGHTGPAQGAPCPLERRPHGPGVSTDSPRRPSRHRPPPPPASSGLASMPAQASMPVPYLPLSGGYRRAGAKP